MKKSNNCRKGFVEIPQITLNTLKGLLFNNEGVDLSNIINDIAADKDQTDLTAINVALTYKGLKPEIDTTTRYESGYSTIQRYEYVGFSLILGVVKIKQSVRTYNSTSKSWEEWRTMDNIACYGFDQWEEWSTNEKESMIEVERHFTKSEK